MSLTVIGNQFDKQHGWGKFESKLIDTVMHNIELKYSNACNLLINGTWFGPQYSNGAYEKISTLTNKIDNVFYLSAIDPPTLNKDQLNALFKQLGNPNIFLLGNFNDSKYNFSAFSYWATESMKNINVRPLNTIKYKFLNYNRKPAQHRVELYNAIYTSQLMNFGVQSLGKYQDNSIISVVSDEIIVEDAWSFGPREIWDHHFLNVVSETTFNWWDDIFISEKTFKPIIGLRPFIINGNWRTYQWLRDNGFKTFDSYFPVQLDDLHENDVIASIMSVLQWICNQSNQTLLEMYNSMLPDLIYNRERAFEFSKEQKHIMGNILL